MLRDRPPLGPRDDELFMSAPGNDDEQPHSIGYEPQHTDPLDDVFGSAPSSPNLAGREGTHATNTDHSDIPRLRSIHVTNGYREGIAVSKEQHIQAGFDEGFSLGGEIGMKVGYILGVLEGIAKAIARAEDERVKKLWEDAQEELKMEKILGEEYFGRDGIWKYDVPGQDVEGQGSVTFGNVARHHPVVRQWRGIVDVLARECGLALEGDE
ncbi:hypothetical protein CLAFUW4_14583 [Fulvia fulva]|uniref:Protein YAE1 n=1 Tax=Passalora fulva TaxID=5499 RepID=A0A9Q8PM57_PASFU|nr:uncharacterized protein CLAFUR5_14413 [Fulvia fulva]KAK4608984.1 hypothetical protein CLAFUR4_14577 [Fulvia fulva]KAK4609651.1 hypothetical protein CLAFUR0_14577 [Fulvia fulva]UJO24922.1 hypothetical protein CLAFUR5_14413 [Fulvia fulva]WPV22566.1 hypothetical protein CLAFUW4_14583 [Fulvia fulva]WPV37780.1 hypothetical protein CLAFUW7_14586 [Fulvia fulva]